MKVDAPKVALDYAGSERSGGKTRFASDRLCVDYHAQARTGEPPPIKRRNQSQRVDVQKKYVQGSVIALSKVYLI